MVLRFSIALIFFLACGSLRAQARPSCAVVPKSLTAMHACFRPLLVFSPQADDARLKVQSAVLDAAADDMMDRFVMLTPVVPDAKGFAAPLDTPYTVLSQQEMDAIRTRFHVRDDVFAVVLLGEDGQEKLRSAKPVDVDRLNALIDSMPERRVEMRRPHAN
jgi:hypothetical protein